MLTPSSYRDEPFSWVRDQGSSREMADHSEENVPLLGGGGGMHGAADYSYMNDGDGREDDEGVRPAEEEEEATERHPSGSTVTCRVCDATIELDGKALQHVVKCISCNEATPIRPAPAGKKYVRCPCNCLLICKAASSRIACPRQNCRRVITLGQHSPGTAMQAPTGTCRVTCAYCDDIFMFNTLSNTLATCPHCRKRSSVGASFRRSRLVAYLSALLVFLVITVILIFITLTPHSKAIVTFALWFTLLLSLAFTFFLAYKTFVFFMARISTIVSPV